MKNTTSRVNRELKGLLKRFFLIHPMAPMLVTGGFTSSVVLIEIDACSNGSSFDQSGSFIVPVHKR